MPNPAVQHGQEHEFFSVPSPVALFGVRPRTCVPSNTARRLSRPVTPLSIPPDGDDRARSGSAGSDAARHSRSAPGSGSGLTDPQESSMSLIRGAPSVLRIASMSSAESRVVIRGSGPGPWSAVGRLAPLTGRDPVPARKRELFRNERDTFGAAGLRPLPSEVVSPARAAQCSMQLLTISATTTASATSSATAFGPPPREPRGMVPSSQVNRLQRTSSRQPKQSSETPRSRVAQRVARGPHAVRASTPDVVLSRTARARVCAARQSNSVACFVRRSARATGPGGPSRLAPCALRDSRCSR
ncbi:hypothetical protein SAMN05421810_11215 [Amycolatopsis arida]|uniref:Uncharacterized protein n=1 Tax=Amycolatopsis arida TaxID=587909 RepID=A0A1I6AD33_9PSEU|nr:hypothetical protein CLV69_102741 [Amycolatopsis arida]SFQ66530.1 hypothetical protein SAMN05421810_11215 [Amycolatopsis arida]